MRVVVSNESKYIRLVYSVTSPIKLQLHPFQLLQTVVGLLGAVRAIRSFRRSPCVRTDALRLSKQALPHQQHAVVCLVDARLVQFGELLRQLQRFSDVRLGGGQVFQLDVGRYALH